MENWGWHGKSTSNVAWRFLFNFNKDSVSILQGGGQCSLISIYSKSDITVRKRIEKERSIKEDEKEEEVEEEQEKQKEKEKEYEEREFGDA